MDRQVDIESGGWDESSFSPCGGGAGHDVDGLRRAQPSAPLSSARGRRAVTFTKDVAPILQRSCQNCHRPESNAPMSLMTYEDARPYARSIKAKTTSRLMPPWHIERNIGIQKFKDDPSLTEQEIATIAAWVDQGAQKGDMATCRRRGRSPTTTSGTSASPI